MTVRDVLNEVRYSKEYVEFENSKKTIEENYNEEQGIFYASNRIKDLEKTMIIEAGPLAKILDRITTKLSSTEDRLYQGKLMSEAYKTMQAQSIAEDCGNLIKMVNDRPTYDKINDKKKLAQIVATTKYAVADTLNARTVFKESTNPLFNQYINEELERFGNIL